MASPEPTPTRRRFYPPTESDTDGHAVFAEVYVHIHRERIRAHAKHDGDGDSMERKEFTNPAWLSVLVEEVGEVAKAMCDHRHHGEYADARAYAIELRDELVQVAAMAAAWIDAIDNDERFRAR